MMDNKIITINNEQRSNYENIDLKNSNLLLNRYQKVLDINSSNRRIEILDVGGATGYFTKVMYDYLKGNGYEVTAYVLDTMRYPNWDNDDNNIIFCEGSVEHVDTYFKGEKFDLIFCNKVFHHFVTDTYSGTLSMIHKCMDKLRHQLSENGKLCILDYFYDGLIINRFPSWMIYQCTSQKNGFLVKIFRKMGSKSAGSGVCFQSEKMWRKLISDCALNIDVFERGPVFPMRMMKRIVFLSHKPVEDCIFICSEK